MTTVKEYHDQIVSSLRVYNEKEATVACQDLIAHLYDSDENIETAIVTQIMKQLRNKRMFSIMIELAEALMQTNRQSFNIRRQYAQALIDLNYYAPALAMLNGLVGDTATNSNDADAGQENKEARGLLGRVYKQLYLNARKNDSESSREKLKQAINYYIDAYNEAPDLHTWHGINALALLKRGEADNIQFKEYPNPDKLASEVLETIVNKHAYEKTNAWDFATAAEACVALNKPKEALEWLSGFARMPYCDVFELSGTLRQLKEVWLLTMESTMGKFLLPMLQSELLKRMGGNIEIETGELLAQMNAEANIDKAYKAMIKPLEANAKIKLEKVFGEDSFQTYKWYMTGAERCLFVARIGRDSSKGHGTGFLLKGNSLNEHFGEELVLITNAHVISADPEEKDALRPEESVVVFEALNRDEEFRVSDIIWSSPSTILDASVLKFSNADQIKLKTMIKEARLYPLSKYLPVPDAEYSQKIYVIGHPAGGTLQLSLRDNILLDHQDPKIHYRTPTEGGSSGSPIFNQQWDLVGIHHAGSKEMSCLNGKKGTYEANEGVWIEAIKKAIAEHIKNQSSACT